MARAVRDQVKYLALGALGLVGAAYATYALTSTRVTNEIEICGEATRVWDFVTTAKHWREWHPATRGVSGDIEHPLHLGDVVHERVKIFGPTVNVEWTVTRVTRPYALTLRGHSRAGGRATIDYRFAPRDNAVKFTRTIAYAFLGFGGPLDWFWIRPLMERQSAEGLTNLKMQSEREMSK